MKFKPKLTDRKTVPVSAIQKNIAQSQKSGKTLYTPINKKSV